MKIRSEAIVPPARNSHALQELISEVKKGEVCCSAWDRHLVNWGTSRGKGLWRRGALDWRQGERVEGLQTVEVQGAPPLLPTSFGYLEVSSLS